MGHSFSRVPFFESVTTPAIDPTTSPAPVIAMPIGTSGDVFFSGGGGGGGGGAVPVLDADALGTGGGVGGGTTMMSRSFDSPSFKSTAPFASGPVLTCAAIS